MKILRFLFGFVAGTGLGFAAGLLLAPESGDDLKSSVRDKIDQVKEEGRLAAERRRVELEAEYATAKRVP